MDIIVTPSKQFRLESINQTAISKAFRSSREAGLFEILKNPSLRNTSDSSAYWYDYLDQFMKSFCTFSDTDPLYIPYNEEYLYKKYQATPMIAGSENITTDLLKEVWLGLEARINESVRAFSGTPRQFVAQEFPGWEDVGKIHFHLAENRAPNGKSFAFLSTYSVRIAGKARVQHRPLGVALKESVRQGDRKHLEQLLSPIYQASKKSNFIANAIQTNAIYAPIYLNPSEAFKFINDISFCEASGIICKVPDWWRKNRPPRATVSVKIGNQKKSKVGFNEILDFDVGVSVGGQSLTKAELKKILEADGSLVDLGGKWIEVDRKRIEQMLKVWDKAVASTYEAGISFSQAMRMLSGFTVGEESLAGGEDNDNGEWLEVLAGKGFKEILQQVRSPELVSQKAITKVLDKHLKGTLRPYQNKGLSWLNSITTLQLGGCLADDMGLGKTIQIIAMLLVQKHHFKTKQPNLLVVPASLLGNWQAEIQKFAPSLKYKVMHSSAEGKVNLKQAPADLNDYDLVMTTYGMVLRQDWLKKFSWLCVIADEAQAIKNSTTKQSKAMRSLKSNIKIAMTGTPVENSLGDLWSIFDFSCPGLLGTSSQFKAAVKKMSDTSSGKSANYGPLRQLISPYILRRKKTDKSIISDLPDKIEMMSTCYLTKKQASLYQRHVKKLELALKESEGIQRKGLVLSSLMKFKQICNHPSQYLADDSYTPAMSGKFTKLKEIVETIAARQEKVLIFTQFRELTDILAHFLGECFGQEGLIIHGGTPIKKRQSLVDKFQKPDGPPFFVLSLKAGGTGLNLTQASHVIHFDRWWNPAVENQATDRVFRIGQKRNVVVHKFVCKGTIEEKIDQMINDKKLLSDALVEKSQEVNLTELSNEALLDLVKLDIGRLGEYD